MCEKRVSGRRRKASMTSRFSSETEKTCLEHHTIMIQQNRSQNMWMKLQCISTCFYLRKTMQKKRIHRFHVLFLSSLILQCLECSGVCIIQKKQPVHFFFLQCMKLLNCTLVVFYSNFLFVLFFFCFLACLTWATDYQFVSKAIWGYFDKGKTQKDMHTHRHTSKNKSKLR